MPLKLFKRYKRDGGFIYHYRGTVAGDECRGSTRTADKKIAARIVSEIEHRKHKSHLDGPQQVLTFPQAVEYYMKAGKVEDNRTKLYVTRLVAYWGDKLVKDIRPGLIRQSAIEIHPNDSGATRNRQVITPTRAIINHCAGIELCQPVRVEFFPYDRKIKKPILPNWLDVFCAHADQEMAALALFMFSTGGRISEARRLEWTDIDFQDRVIQIRKTKARFARMPRMPARLLVALANLPRDAKPFGRPETSLRRSWDAVIAKAAAAVPDFTRLTFHSCRHGVATHLLRKGVDVKTVGSLIGMSAQVLLTNYAHAMQDDAIIDDIFSTRGARGDTAPSKIKALD
jgi:hypothetical protein